MFRRINDNFNKPFRGFCCSYYITTVLVVSVLLSFCPSVRAKDCVQVDQCKCTFDDGSGTVDLTPLGKQSGDPLIKDVFAVDNFAYSFNPCFPFDEGTCMSAAACQFDSANIVYYNIGASTNVAFSYDGLNLIGTYTADDFARTSVVTFVCDANAVEPGLQVGGETGTATYVFTVTSKDACPTGAGPPPVTDPPVTDTPANGEVTITVGISTGWILFIAFLGILSTYLIAGMAINKFGRHNTGKDIVPNTIFWTAIPGLIKEGVLFTIHKVRRRPEGYTPF